MNLQFEISEEEVQKLELLMKESGIENLRTLFNNSLTLFQWAVVQIKAGNTIASVDEAAEKYTEVQMDSLKFVADSAKALNTESVNTDDTVEKVSKPAVN